MSRRNKAGLWASAVLALACISEPAHAEKKPDYYVTAFYRHAFLPTFVPELFEDLATFPSIDVPAAGLEFIFSQKTYDIIVSGWWQRGRIDGAFRVAGEPTFATEWLDSTTHMLMVGATFLGTVPFNKYVAFQYGGGIGIGGVIGDIRRTDAYVDQNGDWQKCQGPGDPGPDPYCAIPRGEGGDDDREGRYNEPVDKWFDGGPAPSLYFRFAPQISLRVTPWKASIIRVDAGVDVFSGPFVGLAAGYGF